MSGEARLAGEPADPEQTLLTRACAGDREAFERLIAAHREAVYRAAWFVLEDREEALDVTQEAFLRAFRHLARFEQRSSFRTWVRRIAVNEALRRRERRQLEPRSGAPAEEELPPAPGERVEDLLARREARQLVRQAIGELPPAARAAVLLRDVEGLSYAEIAAELEIPRGTVMSRIHHGRTLLRRKLEALLGPRAQEIQLARGEEPA